MTRWFLQPDSPDVIRRFRATIRPDAGKSRVFYGKAYDPHLQWAAEMVHGISSQPSVVAGELLNPSPNSRFKQSTIHKKVRNRYISPYIWAKIWEIASKQWAVFAIVKEKLGVYFIYY